MAIGRQVSSGTTLKRLLAWADASGLRVGEHPDFGGVHPVHTANSWHFDGLAADINQGPPGTPASERDHLLQAVRVGRSMGLGLIFDVSGNGVGSAATHRDHLHVDVGPTSNFGDGHVGVGRGDTKVLRCQAALHFGLPGQDNLWGERTDRRFEAVRAASRMHGVTFPHGVEVAQRAVGGNIEGPWDAGSRAAHDRTVRALQGVLGVTRTSIWDDATEAAFLALRRNKKP